MCRLFDIYLFFNVVVILCTLLSANPTLGSIFCSVLLNSIVDCDENYFLTNGQLQNNYKVKNTRVEKRKSFDYAPHLTHQIECVNGLFKYTVC